MIVSCARARRRDLWDGRREKHGSHCAIDIDFRQDRRPLVLEGGQGQALARNQEGQAGGRPMAGIRGYRGALNGIACSRRNSVFASAARQTNASCARPFELLRFARDDGRGPLARSCFAVVLVWLATLCLAPFAARADSPEVSDLYDRPVLHRPWRAYRGNLDSSRRFERTLRGFRRRRSNFARLVSRRRQVIANDPNSQRPWHGWQYLFSGD